MLRAVRLAALGCCCFAGLTSMAAQAGSTTYKWTDAEGQVHYTQTPPPTGTEAEKVVLKKSPPPPEQTTDASDAAQAAADTGSSATDTPQPADVAAKNCEAARKNLEIYTQHSTVKRNGEVVTLSDEERKGLIQEAQDMIEKSCK